MKKVVCSGVILLLMIVPLSLGNLLPLNSSINEPLLHDLEATTDEMNAPWFHNVSGYLPYFIKNDGHLNQGKFYTTGNGVSVFFDNNCVSYYSNDNDGQSQKGHNLLFRLSFDNGNDVNPLGCLPARHYSNYFFGTDRDNWYTSIQHYYEIVYPSIYDGIDMVYRFENGLLKYEFIIHPDADPSLIRIHIESIDSIQLDNSNGDLKILTRYGSYRELKPFSYQMLNDEIIEVQSSFRILDDRIYGFSVGDYDPARILTVDPVQTFGTFVGGSSNDIVISISRDSSQNIVIYGATRSKNFPTSNGTYDNTSNGHYDLFISKLDPTGAKLIWSTHIGGSSNDNDSPGMKLGNGMDLDESDNIYITGYTYSSDFPTTSGVFDTSLNGTYDVFVVKLKDDGTQLIYSSLLGGKSLEKGYDIVVNRTGIAYITGYTDSPDFPMSSNAYRSKMSYPYDCFITALSPNASAIIYSSYFGRGITYGMDVELDPQGNLILAGRTDASSKTFPTTPGAFSNTNKGDYDIFITKFSSNLTSLIFSTLVGSKGTDYVASMFIDKNGDIYVTGATTGNNFPTSPGAVQGAWKGMLDAIVFKMNSTGDSLLYSTYCGGSSADMGTHITVDKNLNAYISGWSLGGGYPTTFGAFDTKHANERDAVLSIFNHNGTELLYSTFLGGPGTDEGHCVLPSFNGTTIVSGFTFSGSFPVKNGSYDISYNGGGDGFIVGIDTEYPTINATYNDTAYTGETFKIDLSISDNYNISNA
ncbi:MAG: hypothetical protein GQ558_05850, partial [Thermoplasmata archaeon]|nr:hypothetical protein [Thermoplasmata archaeon]